MSISKTKHGFTMLELIVVLAIIGILATIAYPGYMESIARGKRSDAKVALVNLQLAQEKYRANCPQYATGIDAATRTCVSAGKHDLVGNTTTEHGYYTLSISNATASTYTLTATATGEQAKDTTCTSLSIDQNSKKTATGTAAATPEKCWK